MTNFAFQQVDVFTSRPLRGNPLAVVVGADALTDTQMAAFANWTNLSETTFLLQPTMTGADYRVRIFTPKRELPFAGHPTLGSCHVWLASGGKPNGHEVVQECEIGLVRVRRGRGRLSFAAPEMRRSGPLETDILARVIEGLHLPPDAIIAANEVEIAVEASGLNFRDVLNALGEYPGDPSPLGLECAGRITAVGAKVTSFLPGDPVLAVAQGSFGSSVTIDARYVAPRPPGMSAEQAATIPIAFLTAWYGLFDLASLKKGERVLIHAAAGGVGLAAVQLALRAGAEVFATANPRKWPVLEALGVRHLASSRTLEFVAHFQKAMGGRGLDVVLNSLTGNFLDQSLGLLAPGGRFVEMGKRDIRSPAALAAGSPGVTYHRLELGEAPIPEILTKIVSGLAMGELCPIPLTAFPIVRAEAAFRFMAMAEHVGKIVLLPATTSGVVRGDATYLITGGLGALGLHVTRWLVAKGARHLVLIGRGRPSEAARAAISALESSGARITVAAVDVSQRGPLKAVLAAIPEAAPLRGVVHAAGVLDDGVLTEQTSERFERVMAPKVLGAWNLHELTKERPLDFFVLFSSVAALTGPAGQSSYAAANAFLDALAAKRHARGLPALSIGWGGWSGGGMLARLDEASRRRLERQAFEPFTPELGLALFERALALGRPHVGAFLFDKGRLQAMFVGGQVPTLLRDVGAVPMGKGPDADIVARLSKLEPDKREAQLRAALQEEAAKVLGFARGSDVAPDRPLTELGLDSLMAVELRNRVAKRTGRSLPATFAFDYPTLERQAQFVLQMLQLGESQRTEPLAGASTRRDDSRRRIPRLKTIRAFEWLELDKIDFFLDGDSVVAELVAREEYGGHGKQLFGGITALLTDFVSPFVSIGLLAGKTFVTTELTVGFDAPIICGEKLTLRAHIEHVDTQRATIRIDIDNEHGRAATATNKVRFVSLRALEQLAATDGGNGYSIIRPNQ
jgi:NADPH:quinone reductase-like Zn-dependent oxidoreductase/acyl-coenzyme A thioesterase PaaI-like protein/acyl carrier protein